MTEETFRTGRPDPEKSPQDGGSREEAGVAFLVHLPPPPTPSTQHTWVDSSLSSTDLRQSYPLPPCASKVLCWGAATSETSGSCEKANLGPPQTCLEGAEEELWLSRVSSHPGRRGSRDPNPGSEALPWGLLLAGAGCTGRLHWPAAWLHQLPPPAGFPGRILQHLCGVGQLCPEPPTSSQISGGASQGWGWLLPHSTEISPTSLEASRKRNSVTFAGVSEPLFSQLTASWCPTSTPTAVFEDWFLQLCPLRNL
ncbi:uncharacterized protein LOC128626244 [Artibeus jamaicensis]|uniref:uncharacterized protein LOC128626244 n=1 Tax=Artibeus jamaicensis TaxID=9417 RepID=UPI00235A5063|nr:uncharacterized protein LOC128626244 [Artibeus jamaicensis]